MYTMDLQGCHIKLFTEQSLCKPKYFSLFERRGRKQRLFLTYSVVFKNLY